MADVKVKAPKPGDVCKDCRSRKDCQYKDDKPVACLLKHRIGSTLSSK